MAVMHSFGLEDHYTSKIFAKGLKSGKNEDEKSFNVSRIRFQYHNHRDFLFLSSEDRR